MILIDGSDYWLGACWGIWRKSHGYFDIGNCVVYKSQTIYAKWGC